MKDSIYQNTRKMILSDANPYFFKGKAGEGIGGPHVGFNYVWPMSIVMRANTTTDITEIRKCVQMLRDTDGNTGFMHETFHKDNASAKPNLNLQMMSSFLACIPIFSSLTGITLCGKRILLRMTPRMPIVE